MEIGNACRAAMPSRTGEAQQNTGIQTHSDDDTRDMCQQLMRVQAIIENTLKG